MVWHFTKCGEDLFFCDQWHFMKCMACSLRMSNSVWLCVTIWAVWYGVWMTSFTVCSHGFIPVRWIMIHFSSTRRSSFVTPISYSRRWVSNAVQWLCYRTQVAAVGSLFEDEGLRFFDIFPAILDCDPSLGSLCPILIIFVACFLRWPWTLVIIFVACYA